MSKKSFEDHAAMPSTHWSVIDRTRAGNVIERRRALDDLLQRYLPALRAHLIWKRRFDSHTAEDIVQGFIVNKVLERNLLETADQRLGKFRTLLLRALDNFAIDELRKRRPDHRTDGRAADIDLLEHGLASPRQQNVDAFELVWAQRALVEALERMRRECLASGHAQTWEIFDDRVVRPALDANAKPIPYDQLLDRYHFDSPQQAANVLAGAKRKFRRHFEGVIAEYAGPGELREEMEHLRRVAAAGGGQRLDLADLTRAAVRPVKSPDSDFDAVDPSRLPEAFSQEEPGNPWLETEQGPLFCHYLSIPLKDLVPDVDAAQLPFPELSLRELFMHPAPPLELLRTTKEYARHCARTSGSISPEMAAVIYNACIAVALERHAIRITKSPDDVLDTSFRIIMQYPWIPVELRHLIEQAVSRDTAFGCSSSGQPATPTSSAGCGSS